MAAGVEYYICDTEVYKNYFLAVFVGPDTRTFELGFGKDETQELREFLSRKLYLVGFNMFHYDNAILEQAISPNCTNQCIKTISDRIIENKEVFYPEVKWKTIDLIRQWPQMVRERGVISLKALAVRLRWPKIQELPYKPNVELSEIEAMEVKKYCFNDVEITKALFEKLKPDLKLRQKAKTLFGINALNMDGSMLGTEILFKMANVTSKDANKRFPLNVRMGNFIPNFVFSEKAPITKKLYKKMQEVIFTKDRCFDEEIIWVNPDGSKIKSVYGEGGLHGMVNRKIIIRGENELFEDQDADSLYPALAAIWNFFPPHLPEMCNSVIKVRDYRIEKKRAGIKDESTLYKLALNAVVGKMKSEYSWLYYPIGNLLTCMVGQLCLTYLTELYINNGINVIQQNTDGVSIIYDKSKSKTVQQILEHVSSIFKLNFTKDYFDKMYARHVNSYIAVLSSGQIKKKGFFETEDKPLEKVDNNAVVAKAVIAYLLNNIPVSDYLKSNKDIYDFCAAPRVDKKYSVTWNGQPQQNLNRFFVSENGAYLYKRKKESKDFEFVLAGWGVTLFNDHIDKPFEDYRIDYRFYKAKIYDALNELFDNQQTSLL